MLRLFFLNTNGRLTHEPRDIYLQSQRTGRPIRPRQTLMKRFLLILVALVVVLAGAVAALLTDANLKRVTETWLSAQMGRELKVDGAFSAQIGDPLRVTANSVRLANPDWVGTPDMLTAERVEVAIDPWTILGDAPLILNQLVISKLNGGLVSDAQGRANWDFGEAGSGGANFLMKALQVTDSALQIRRPDVDPVSVKIDKLQQTENGDGLLKTELTGQLSGRPVTARGELGPFKNLLTGTDVRIALRASLGGLKITGVGLIDDFSDPRQPELKLTFDAPDAREVAAMLGLRDTGEGLIKLGIEIVPAGTGVSFKAVGNAGKTTLDLKGSIADLSKLDGVALTATGGGPNMRNTATLLGYGGFPALPFSFNGDVSRQDKELDIHKLKLKVGDFDFLLEGDLNRFPSLNDADLTLSAKGDDAAAFRELFGLPGVAQGKFSLEGKLRRGPQGQDTFRASAQSALGKGTVNGTLGPAPDYTGTRASVEGDGENLQEFGTLLGLKGLKAQPFQLKAEVEVVADGYRLDKGTGMQAGELAIDVTGVLGKQPLEQGTQLQWRVSGIDIAEAARLAELPMEFPSRPLAAAGGLQTSAAGYGLQDVKGTIGKARFALAGTLGRGKNLQGTNMQVSLQGPELERLAFLVGDVNLPAGPFELSGRVARTADGIRVSQSQVTVAGAKGKVDGELALPTDNLRVQFDIEMQGPNAKAIWEDRFGVEFAALPFTVDAQGELNDERWRLDDGLVKVGATQAQITGNLRRSADSGALKINASSPDLSKLGSYDGQALPAQPLSLTGTLSPKGKTLQLSDFLASSGKDNLGGQLTYTPGQPPSVKGSVTSTFLDLSWMISPAGEPPAEDDAAKSAQPKDGAVIPAWPLPLDGLKRVNADLNLQADDIHLRRREVKNLKATLRLQDGALRLAPFNLGGGNAGSVDLEFDLTPAPGGAELKLKLDAKALATGLLLRDETDVSALPKGDWTLRLSARGSTLRELVANLNGTGQVASAGGRLSNTRTESLLSGEFFTSVIAAVNPYSKTDPYTKIVCAVFPFTFTDGVMNTAPTLVMQTDKLNILSHGKIDLGNEKLDLSFRTEARKRLRITAGSVVNPFIRIGGTLAEPKLALDKGGALVQGGAAFFTAGLSLLAKTAFDSAFSSSDPCGKALEEAAKAFAKTNGDGK